MSREYNNAKLVEFDDCTIIHITEKGGVKVYIGELDEEVWLYQDMIHEDSEIWQKGQIGKLVISTQDAMRKGLI